MLISANLGFDYVLASQAQKHVTMNEAIAKLDVLVQATALDKDLTSPPADPAEGDTYIVDSTAAGDWLGQEGKLASFLNGAWIFYTPNAGWKVYLVDESTVYDYDGAAWVIKSISADTLFNGSLLKLGVNTGATDTARLSVKSDTIVFSHDDVTPGTGSIDTVFNKDTTGDTLSLTFQTGFSGRVIAGLLGNDDFTVRVSDDGAAFNDALIIDAASAKTDFKVIPSINGNDVWHAGNVGAGSGLDADLLDGIQASAFAQLSGATFTGGITATGFTGNGGALTGVDADNLGGQSAASYALLSGATFSGAVSAASFSGDGASLTNVDADTLDGVAASSFAQLSGATFTGGITATGFTGNGGALTGVDADNLGGQSAASYALLSGATFSGAVSAASFSGDGAGLTNVSADSLDGNSAGDFALLSGATFTGNVNVDHPSSPDINIRTTAPSSQDAKLTIGGARTGNSAAEIGALNFRNHTADAHDMVRIVAQDPAGDDAFGRGKFKLQTADGGVLSDHFVVDYDGSAEFYQSLIIQGGTAWHANNDGTGSGLDADLLDGNHATAFAQISGAVFSGSISAPSVTSLYNSNSPSTGDGLIGGRSSVQYVNIHGGSGGNYLTSVSDVANPKSFLISVTDTVTTNEYIFRLDGVLDVPAVASAGTVTASLFSGNGSSLTDVDALYLNGQSASSYALLSGATFSGAVSAASFSGDGAGLTNVDAETLDGVNGASFVQSGTEVSLKKLSITDADNAFSWENGVNWINGNDGGGNVNVRFGHNHGADNYGGNDEVFTHAGTAYYIGGNLDSAGGTFQFKVASNGGAGVGEPVDWGSVMILSDTDLTWDGDQVLTEGNVNSITVAGDFAVVQANGGVANVIWWDTSADTLYLGTDGSGGGVVSMRAPLEAPLGLGVGGASPDATNAFAFYGTNMLFNTGGSIDATFNKNATGNDASFSFKSAFGSKAILGLLGDDNFTLKVGSSFTAAMIADETTGKVGFPEGLNHPKLQAYMNTSTFTLTTGWQNLTGWDGTISYDTSGFTWSSPNGDCYIGKTGTFFVAYSISTEVSAGSARTDSLAKLQQYDGAAWNDVPGTIHRMYNRLAGRGGTCAAWTGILDADLGDGFRIQVQAEDGTDTVIVDQASLMIYRM